MAGPPGIQATAQAGFAAMEAELARAADAATRSVYTKAVSGAGHIAHTFSLDRKFRLVFARCHFVGGLGTAAVTIAVDSAQGTAHDADLTQVKSRGNGADLSLTVPGTDLAEPSPWTFQPGDAIRITWTNPDPLNMTWGLEVGLALAT